MELTQIISTMPVDPMYTPNELVRLALEANKVKSTTGIMMAGQVLYNKLLLLDGMNNYYVDLFVGHWGNFALYLHALLLSFGLWNEHGELNYEFYSVNPERLVLSKIVPLVEGNGEIQGPVLPCY